jgi:hypothetical protein
MPYILVVMFFAGGGPYGGPARLDHIDSIRFDNKAACMLARNEVMVTAAHGAKTVAESDRVRPDCVPASAE